MRRWWTLAGLLVAFAGGGATPTRAQEPALAISVGAPEQGWPLHVRIGNILFDPGLRSALDSALPLRLHLRAELWQNRTLDRLVGWQEISVAVLREPLGPGYTVETRDGNRSVETLAAAQTALAEILRPEIVPRENGRHYYIVTLEVETLSLSDLDELRRWLRGEVAPALGGQSNASRALERGVRRLFVRVIGLPARRFEARTATFTRE